MRNYTVFHVSAEITFLMFFGLIYLGKYVKIHYPIFGLIRDSVQLYSIV